MKYIILLFFIIIIVNIKYYEKFVTIKSYNSITPLGKENLYYKKFHPIKVIKINNQINFKNRLNSKNTIDPNILLKSVFLDLINKNIIFKSKLNKLNNNLNLDYINILKDIENLNKELLRNIKLNYNIFILENKSKEYNCFNTKNCNISIYDYYIYSIEFNNKNNKKYDIQYIFYINGSEYFFVYKFTIIVLKNIFNVSKICLEGMTTNLYNQNLNSNFSYYDENIKDIYKIENLNEILEKENVNTIFIENFNNKEINNEKYQCFGSEGNNKYDCENEYDDYGNKKKPGKWDRKCVLNEECPFYKSNKNYKNEFGGCIDGYCELPLNMESISPHYYKEDINKQPYCHNYSLLSNQKYDSCYLQNNKFLYNDFKSPDYAFKNDENIRNVNIKDFYNK